MIAEPVDAFRAVPAEARRIWREHFGLFAADPGGDAVLVHLSIDPVRREGVFTMVSWVAGRRFKDIARAPVPGTLADLTSLHSERLRFDIVAPGEEARVRYAGNGLALDLRYRTLLGPHRAPPGGDNALFPVDNEQQSVRVDGTVEIDGAARPFDGLGSRDHSWGWFPEWPFQAHEWLTIVLPGRTFQLSKTERLNGAHNQSLVSLVPGGSRPVAAATIEEPYWRVAPGEHLPVLDRNIRVRVTEADERETLATLHLGAARCRHHSNKRDRQLDRMYEQVTMFAPVSTDDGETGVAIVELGRLLERAGVCDEQLPGAAPSKAAEEGK